MRSLHDRDVAVPVSGCAWSVQWVVRWSAAVAISAAILLATSGSRAFAQSGKQDYDEHCADCHGLKGDGKGTAKVLSPEYLPPDLTHLAQQNGGKFPFDRVVSIIDGREKIPSHARIEMPFWGVTMQEPGKEFTAQSNAQVKARIDAMAKYVETLQVK
jgi:mono/diheme cytochrome c family protein